MAKLYTIHFKIELTKDKIYSNYSKGWLLKNIDEYILITTGHGICLDKSLKYTIIINDRNEEFKLSGTIFKMPIFTNIIIMKIENLNPQMMISNYFPLSKITKNIFKNKNKNKLYFTAYDRLIEIKFINISIITLCHVSLAPKQILIIGKINEKIILTGYSGTPIISINENNNPESIKVIGILDQHNSETGKIKIIPSYYIWKTLIIDENIIQGVDLPIVYENKQWVFNGPINNIRKLDILKKIDGYKLTKNGYLWDMSFGIYVPLSSYFLTKENSKIIIEIARNRNIMKFTVLLIDINYLLPVKIYNSVSFLKNNDNIELPINSGNLIFLRKAFNVDNNFL